MLFGPVFNQLYNSIAIIYRYKNEPSELGSTKYPLRNTHPSHVMPGQNPTQFDTVRERQRTVQSTLVHMYMYMYVCPKLSQ